MDAALFSSLNLSAPTGVWNSIRGHTMDTVCVYLSLCLYAVRLDSHADISVQAIVVEETAGTVMLKRFTTTMCVTMSHNVKHIKWIDSKGTK